MDKCGASTDGVCAVVCGHVGGGVCGGPPVACAEARRALRRPHARQPWHGLLARPWHGLQVVLMLLGVVMGATLAIPLNALLP